MKKKCFSVFSIVVFTMMMFSSGKAQSINSNKESARIFVQNFYDWYVGIYTAGPVKNHDTSTDIVAVNKRKEDFDLPLRKALIDDNREQAKIKDEVTGLDFDPFLNTQDTGFKYQTGNVKQVRDNFFVDIRSAENGKPRKATLASRIAVVAEVVKADGHWKFVNFIYPSQKRQDDLLDILRTLKKDRH